MPLVPQALLVPEASTHIPQDACIAYCGWNTPHCCPKYVQRDSGNITTGFNGH